MQNDGEESAHDGGDRGQTRSAMMQMEECGPTGAMSELVGIRPRAGLGIYLDLQGLIAVASNSLVMHFMVRIIRIAAALVLDEGEAGIYQQSETWTGTRHGLTDDSRLSEEQEYHSELDGHSCRQLVDDED
jgi:hypothetical protein